MTFTTRNITNNLIDIFSDNLDPSDSTGWASRLWCRVIKKGPRYELVKGSKQVFTSFVKSI